MVMTKVIHVHLIHGRKNYYFGSISAIYTVLTEDEVGIKKSSLLHAGLADGGVILNKKAMIRQGELIRGPSMPLTRNVVDGFFKILTIHTIPSVDGVGLDLYKAIDELFGRKKVNIIDKHVNSGNLSVKFEVFLKKIYYMIHGEEMRPSGDSNKVTLSTCIFAFDCLKRLRYSPRETEQKLSGYLNLIRNNRNTSEGNGAHASYLLTEAQLDENIKAFATLYLYVTGMCYDELKAKYDI